ncbi:MAG: hypothetical protein OHK0039_22170 [Bacteroidia bacterium]
MRLLLFVVFLEVWATSLQAGIDPPPGAGARAVGLGYAYAAVSGDVWAAFLNPAGIATTDRLAAATHVEQRYLLSELRYARAGLVAPLPGTQALGLTIDAGGLSGYRETGIGLAYGITLLDHIDLGARFSYVQLDLGTYGASGTPLVDVGVQARLSDQIRLGFSAANVNRGSLQVQGGERQYLPTVARAGLAFQAGKQALLVADVSKDIDHPASFRVGVEYQLHELVVARVGYATAPQSLHAGLGLRWRALDLDVAATHTRLLGASLHVSAGWQLGRSAQR